MPAAGSEPTGATVNAAISSVVSASDGTTSVEPPSPRFFLFVLAVTPTAANLATRPGAAGRWRGRVVGGFAVEDRMVGLADAAAYFEHGKHFG